MSIQELKLKLHEGRIDNTINNDDNFGIEKELKLVNNMPNRRVASLDNLHHAKMKRKIAPNRVILPRINNVNAHEDTQGSIQNLSR